MVGVELRVRSPLGIVPPLADTPEFVRLLCGIACGVFLGCAPLLAIESGENPSDQLGVFFNNFFVVLQSIRWIVRRRSAFDDANTIAVVDPRCQSECNVMYECYSRLLPIIVLLSSRGASSKDGHSVCQSGIEFWSSVSGRCESCTVCEPAFTISPCVVHRDAICGPFSALELKLSFLSATTPRAYIPTDTENQKNFDKPNWMPWDWQTGALILAVCACVVFFIVAACSAIVYARDWRKMKKNFDRASLEEISTRLNLMVKAELAELASGAPMNPGDPEMRCQYLEKLLDRKREPVTAAWPEARSNLYIEEGESPSSQHTHIARIHRNIENILKNSKR